MYVRRFNGASIELGVSGRLWRDALVMYDRTTGSFWSQIDGRAIAGRAEGNRLEELAAVMTDWGRWKSLHPDTLVLKPDKWAMKGSRYEDYFRSPSQLGILGTSNPDERMNGKYLVLGFSVGKQAGAVKLAKLVERGLVESAVGSTPVLILRQGTQDGRVYSRRVGDRTLTFAGIYDGTLTDRETGTTWNPETGRAIEGPLAGVVLESIESRRAYWFIWSAFHPETVIVRTGDN